MHVTPEQMFTVITSAAIATVISALITQVGLWFDRRQKSELAKLNVKKSLFNKAIDLALADRGLQLEIAKATKTGGGIIPPAAVSVAQHFQYLNHIYENGTVPDEVIQIIQQQIDEQKKART
jgi:hypothetical protein